MHTIARILILQICAVLLLLSLLYPLSPSASLGITFSLLSIPTGHSTQIKDRHQIVPRPLCGGTPAVICMLDRTPAASVVSFPVSWHRRYVIVCSEAWPCDRLRRRYACISAFHHRPRHKLWKSDTTVPTFTSKNS